MTTGKDKTLAEKLKGAGLSGVLEVKKADGTVAKLYLKQKNSTGDSLNGDINTSNSNQGRNH